MAKFSFLYDPQNRRWLWRILLALLIFLLLAWAVWLYFMVKLHQLPVGSNGAVHENSRRIQNEMKLIVGCNVNGSILKALYLNFYT